jgi:hypothetical protein
MQIILHGNADLYDRRRYLCLFAVVIRQEREEVAAFNFEVGIRCVPCEM